MSVYIDNMNAPYRGMKMCHMVADDINELHEMANKIGLKRSWFQDGSSHPHYDICLSKKQLAISFGAKAITVMELGRKFLRRTK